MSHRAGGNATPPSSKTAGRIWEKIKIAKEHMPQATTPLAVALRSRASPSFTHPCETREHLPDLRASDARSPSPSIPGRTLSTKPLDWALDGAENTHRHSSWTDYLECSR